MRGEVGEEGGDVVRNAGAVSAFDFRHDGGNRAIQRELDQHAGRGGHRTRHGIQKAAGAPVQQRTHHQEDQVIGIQTRNRLNEGLAGELLHHPAHGQRHQHDDEDGAVLQPFTGARWLGQFMRHFLTQIDLAVSRITRCAFAGSCHIGHHDGHNHQRCQHHAGLPQKDGLRERNHAGNRQNAGRQAGRVGLQLRRR